MDDAMPFIPQMKTPFLSIFDSNILILHIKDASIGPIYICWLDKIVNKLVVTCNLGTLVGLSDGWL